MLENYEAFVYNPNNCCKPTVVTPNESYRWPAQSLEEFKSFNL
jgi:hypothetical protein